MILAVDVDYRTDGSTVAVGIKLQNWTSNVAEQTVIPADRTGLAISVLLIDLMEPGEDEA